MTEDEVEKGCDAGNPTEGPRVNKGIFASNLKNLRVMRLTVFPLLGVDFPKQLYTVLMRRANRLHYISTLTVHQNNNSLFYV